MVAQPAPKGIDMLQRLDIDDLPDPAPTASWAAWLRLHGPDVATVGEPGGWDFRAAAAAFDTVMRIEQETPHARR